MRRTLHFGVGLSALVLAACTSTTEAPVVQGAIKQNWLGQDSAQIAPRVAAQTPQRQTAASPAAFAYQQPISPLLAEEDLEPAAGPASRVVQPRTIQSPAVVARPSAFVPATPARVEAATTTYTISEKDTLYRIARAHNTTPDAIMRANNLRDITDLEPGRTLTIPANTQTQSASLAESIKSYLESPVAPATPVALAPQAPAQVVAAPAIYDVARIEPAAGGTKTGEQAKKTPEPTMQQHKVATGETIYRISKTYGISVLDVMAANDLAKPEALQAGMVLNIPTNATPEAAAVERAQTAAVVGKPTAGVDLRPAADLGVADATRATIEAQRELQAKLQAEASATRAFDPDKGTDGAASVQPLKDAKPLQDSDRLKAELKRGTIDRAAAAQNGMVWPVHGDVVKKFGEKGQGVAYTGINIAVPVGTPVLASEAGTVLYANSGLRMYGNMVLIRHTNGIVAAYAHNSHLLVRKGEKVKKGQVIAVSGQSGNAASPQLHYELRRNSVALDPLNVLPKL